MTKEMIQSRHEFYENIHGKMPYGPNSMERTLEAYAPTSLFARTKLAELRGDDCKLAQSMADSSTADAKAWEGAAVVTDTVSDMVTFGAHRNLQKAYNDATSGHKWQAAKELVAGGGKVVASAVMWAPGKAAGAVKAGWAGRGVKAASLANTGRNLTWAGRGLQELSKFPGARYLAKGACDLVQTCKELAPGALKTWQSFQKSRLYRVADTIDKVREGFEKVGDWHGKARLNQAVYQKQTQPGHPPHRNVLKHLTLQLPQSQPHGNVNHVH